MGDGGWPGESEAEGRVELVVVCGEAAG